MLLGSAYGKVELDSTGVVKGVTTSTSSLLKLAEVGEAVGAAMQSLGSKLTLGVTLPIIALGGASLKAANDLGDAKDKVNLIFGSMSDSIVQWSKTTANSFGISSRAALDATGDFGNLFTQFGVGIDAASKMSESLVGLAGDIAEFNGESVDTVLGQLQSGLVGRGIALKKLGIDLSDATVKEKAVALGLADVNGQFSQAALVQARYALIMEQTTKVQGFFAGKTGDVSAEVTKMRANLENALGTLGENLLPVALKVVEALNKMLVAFQNLNPFQQKMIVVFLGLAAAAGPVLFVLGSIISTISALVVVAEGLAGLGISFAGIGAAITGTLIPAILAIATTLAPIILTVGAIILVLGLLYIAWKKNLFGIQDLVAKSAQGYRQAWQRFTDWWQKNTAEAGANVQTTFAKIRENIQGAFSNLGLTTAWNNFTTWLKNSLTGIVNYIAKAFSGVSWSTLGKQILFGLANGLLAGLPTLLNIVIQVAQSVLAQIKKSLGISSPSKEAMKLGLFTGQGFSLGVMKGMDPDVIARTIAKPVTQSNSTQQVITQHFASGVTMRQVQSAIAENNEQLMNTFITNLGGA